MCIVAMSPTHRRRHHATQLWIVCRGHNSQVCSAYHGKVTFEIIVVQVENEQCIRQVTAAHKDTLLDVDLNSEIQTSAYCGDKLG